MLFYVNSRTKWKNRWRCSRRPSCVHGLETHPWFFSSTRRICLRKRSCTLISPTISLTTTVCLLPLYIYFHHHQNFISPQARPLYTRGLNGAWTGLSILSCFFIILPTDWTQSSSKIRNSNILSVQCFISQTSYSLSYLYYYIFILIYLESHSSQPAYGRIL